MYLEKEQKIIAETQYHLFLVAGNSDFDAGMNTILVPTPILFGSRFWNMTNTTDQVNVTTDLPDYMVNASWTMYNDTNLTSQITFVISFNCTVSEASELLSHFLHNVTGNKTCWYDDITDEIYTVGLPIHVTNFLPSDYVTFVRWEGQGEDPADNDFPYLSEAYDAVCSVGNGFRDGVEYYTGIDVINGLVWVFETAVDFYISCVQAVWEWGLGAAKSAVDALQDIKDAVQDALNFMAEWIIEHIMEAYILLFNGLKSVIEPLSSTYYTFLTTCANVINEGSDSVDYNDTSDDQPFIPPMINFIVELAITVNYMAAICWGFIGCLILYKAKTCGFSDVLSSRFTELFKNVVLGLVLSTFAFSIAAEAVDELSGPQISPGDRYNKSLDILGLGLETGSSAVAIGQCFLKYQQTKSSSKGWGKYVNYYTGLTLAFLGLIAEATKTIKNLSGEELKIVDILCIIISGSGLGIMMWENKEAKLEKAKNLLSKLIVSAEWFIAGGGAVFAVYNALDHSLGGDW